jgi:hypothetical protein
MTWAAILAMVEASAELTAAGEDEHLGELATGEDAHRGDPGHRRRRRALAEHLGEDDHGHRRGCYAVIWTLEMDDFALQARMVAQHARIQSNDVLHGRLPRDESTWAPSWATCSLSMTWAGLLATELTAGHALDLGELLLDLLGQLEAATEGTAQGHSAAISMISGAYPRPRPRSAARRAHRSPLLLDAPGRVAGHGRGQRRAHRGRRG